MKIDTAPYTGSNRENNFSVRLGKLNLIVLTNAEEFEVWRDTALGLAQIGNVDRETAVKAHRDALWTLKQKRADAKHAAAVVKEQARVDENARRFLNNLPPIEAEVPF